MIDRLEQICHQLPHSEIMYSQDNDVILIVDDSPVNLSVLSKSLKSAGFKVRVATDGESAIEQVEYEPPELILLDVQMPGIDGFETCTRLKSKSTTQDIPIIFITAFSDTDNKVKGLSLGAVDYIAKPFQEQEVLARVKNHLTIRHLQKHLLTLNQELKRSNTELEQFAFVVSHDLRAPLRKMKSYAELLRDTYEGRLDAKADKYIEALINGSLRMQSLIGDLLTYSRVGKSELVLEPVNLNVVLKQVIDDHSDVISKNAGQIRADSLPTVMAHKGQMLQLFQNLLENSIKFREGAPVIEVRAERQEPQSSAGTFSGGGFEPAQWLISFADNGIGIEAQHAEQVFEIFQKLHPRTQYDGTGLGLAICRKIVKSHGGDLWLESEPGRGTTFYFTLSAV